MFIIINLRLFLIPYFQCRFSVLPALALDGVIYSSIQIGSFNGDTFLEFIQGLCQEMNPYPAPRSVLVLDNCSIHHVDGVAELCQARCVFFLSFLEASKIYILQRHPTRLPTTILPRLQSNQGNVFLAQGIYSASWCAVLVTVGKFGFITSSLVFVSRIGSC